MEGSPERGSESLDGTSPLRGSVRGVKTAISVQWLVNRLRRGSRAAGDPSHTGAPREGVNGWPTSGRRRRGAAGMAPETQFVRS